MTHHHLNLRPLIIKKWDFPIIQPRVDLLLSGTSDVQVSANLMAALALDSGANLNALLLSTIGLHMGDDTIRVAMGLQLGASFCCHSSTFSMVHGAIEQLERHGLVCR